MMNHYYTEGSYCKPVKAFRGSAKSTNTCYAALHRTELPRAYYTLIISDTTTQAETLVADISDMLRESSLGYKVIRDVTGELELEFQGKRYFIVGKGAGASLRGIKRGRNRPDLIILDDIINDEAAANRVRVERLNRWYYAALLPSLDPEGEIYAVGTPLSQGDLFMHLCSQHPTVEFPLTPTSWPDRFSPKWIESKKAEYMKAGMKRQWVQEFELVLTDSDTQAFDTRKINHMGIDDLVYRHYDWYVALDGAFSEKSSSDESAIVACGIDTSGNWVVVPYAFRDLPQKVIAELFKVQKTTRSNFVGIEKGAYLLSMKYEMDKLMRTTKQYFKVNELSTQGSKISRILALEPLINRGLVTIVDTGKASEDLLEQLELTDREACRAKHDDLIDAFCQVLQMTPHDKATFDPSELTDAPRPYGGSTLN